MSKIEYVDKSWITVTGCTSTSAGCFHCFARGMTKRLQGICRKRQEEGLPLQGFAKYEQGWNPVVCHDKELDMPGRFPQSCRFFVNPMADTFHSQVPIRFIQQIFSKAADFYWHKFLVLTKRARRLEELTKDGYLTWFDNIWMGVSVEQPNCCFRIGCLRKTGARIKWLSIEPLLKRISDLDLQDIDWVVCGAETGPGARYMDPEWARDIRDQCREQGVAFFMKKMSNKEPIPDDLMIREFPDESDPTS